MDGKCGATGAGERSEHAPGVRRFTVHCSAVLGAMILVLLKLRYCDGLGTLLISAFWFPLSLTDDLGLRRCDTGKKR